MQLQKILTHFADVKQAGKGYAARCPAHEDRNPSLTIYPTVNAKGDEYAAIKCRSGCEWKTVLSKAGLRPADVYFKNDENEKPNSGAAKLNSQKHDIDFNHPTKIYSYTDEDGGELYQNCRYESDKLGNRLIKKTFIQRRKQGDKWIYSLDDTRRVPYNFPAILQEPSVIYDTEGEKDAETLIDLGLTATSTVKEAYGEFHKYCKGKIVAVCEDNDKPGRDKAKEKAEAYWTAGAIVKILTFRDMPEKSDVTDWVLSNPDENDVFALQQRLIDTPEFSPLDPLRVTFAHEKRKQTTVIEIDGRRALPSGCIGGLTAGIGRGKSHFLQIIAAEAVKRGCEPESKIVVNLEPGEKVVLVDTEQTRDDCFDVLTRMLSRCGDSPELLSVDGMAFRQFDVLSMIDLEFAERKEKLALVLTRPENRLVLLDGLLDFIANPNDPTEGTNFIVWLFTMAAKHDKAIFCTIHGNRGDENGKAKGWIGDVFQRKATCFLLLRKHKQNQDVRVITTEFENVKMRHGKDTDLNIAMGWDENIHGFACIPYPREGEKLSKDFAFTAAFEQAGKDRMSKKELVNVYAPIAEVSPQTAYRHVTEAVNAGILSFENLGGSLFYVLGDIL